MKKELLFIPLVIIFIVCITIIFYYNYDLDKINKRIKKDNYKLEQENYKLKKENLKYKVGKENE